MSNLGIFGLQPLGGAVVAPPSAPIDPNAVFRGFRTNPDGSWPITAQAEDQLNATLRVLKTYASTILRVPSKQVQAWFVSRSIPASRLPITASAPSAPPPDPNVVFRGFLTKPDGSWPLTTQAEDQLNATLRSLKLLPASILAVPSAQVQSWFVSRSIDPSRVLVLPTSPGLPTPPTALSPVMTPSGAPAAPPVSYSPDSQELAPSWSAPSGAAIPASAVSSAYVTPVSPPMNPMPSRSAPALAPTGLSHLQAQQYWTQYYNNLPGASLVH